MRWAAILMVLLLSLGADAQHVRLRNTSAIQQDSPVLFLGMTNRLTVSATGVKPNELYVVFTDADGRPVPTGYHLVRDSVAEIGVQAFLSYNELVSVVVSHRGKQLLRARFRTEKTSFPVASLGGLRDSIVTRAAIQMQDGIVVKDSAGRVRLMGYFRVTSYHFAAEDGEARFEEEVAGPQLTRSIRDIVEQLRNGSRITFSEIRATCPDCTNVRLNDLRLTIMRR